jgi:hypothetical protein
MNAGRFKMKKILVAVMVLVVGIMFVSPTIGYSGPWDRYPSQRGSAAYGGYRGNYDRQPYYPPAPVRHERSRNNNNDALLVAGVAIGGIALGALLGSVISQQNTTRQVVYSEPVYTQPSGYSTTSGYGNPPGQWVTVAGQWVNGQWVPSHTVWVPVNP